MSRVFSLPILLLASLRLPVCHRGDQNRETTPPIKRRRRRMVSAGVLFFSRLFFFSFFKVRLYQHEQPVRSVCRCRNHDSRGTNQSGRFCKWLAKRDWR
uniref:Putative secreted protein n=1 Tax=Anopheles triannulatus TaxID=58253 RepID=A0A2M4B6D2_9DIPT